MLAIIGGDPVRFAPYTELYHRALDELGQPAQPIGVHSPGFVAATDDEARDLLWPHYRSDARPDRPGPRLAAGHAATSTTPRRRAAR